MSRAALAVPKPEVRTRTGVDLARLSGVDGRTSRARRFRELVVMLLLTRDTRLSPVLTEAQIGLARRSAGLIIACESMETEMAKGEKIDMAAYTSTINTLRRTLADAGLTVPAELQIRM